MINYSLIGSSESIHEVNVNKGCGLLEIFIKLIKTAIIYKLYKIYSVESLKSCDFSYSSLKMMSILIQQRMPVIMLFFGIMKSY